MDHVGDMARYINQGLQAIGYPGIGQLWDGERYNENYHYNEDDGTVTMRWVWGKDEAFTIVIHDDPDYEAQST